MTLTRRCPIRARNVRPPYRASSHMHDQRTTACTSPRALPVWLIKICMLAHRRGRQTKPTPARACAVQRPPGQAAILVRRGPLGSVLPTRSACGYVTRPVSADIRKMFRIASSLDTVLRASRTMKGMGRRVPVPIGILPPLPRLR